MFVFRVLGIFLVCLLVDFSSSAVRADERVSLRDADGLKLYRLPKSAELIVEANRDTLTLLDGDTFSLSILRFRLKGIDAIEPGQSCGRTQCGELARQALDRLFDQPVVRCSIAATHGGRPKTDRNRFVASCFAGDTNVAAEMVRTGWAFADKKQTVPEFVVLESEARLRRLGGHKFDVEKPWIWRKRVNKRNRPTDPIQLFGSASTLGKKNFCDRMCQAGDGN